MPLYKGQPLLDAQMAMLRGSGLALHKFAFMKGLSLRGGLNTRLHKQRHSNQLVDGDAIFVRDLMAPETIDDEKLRHLAILSDAVFESFDFCLRCLDLLLGRGVIDRGRAERYVGMLPDLA